MKLKRRKHWLNI